MTETEAWAAQLPPHEGSKSMANIDTSTEAVERLLEDVTPGPWAWEESHPTNACAEVTAEIDGGWPFALATLYGSSEGVSSPTEPDEPWGDHPIRRANARFIAAARDLVPALLKERDEARAQLASATYGREVAEACNRGLVRLNEATQERADRAEAMREAASPDEITRLQARVKVLEEAGNRLSFMAQTSGGTAGRDDGLMAAIDGWTATLAARIPADPVTNADCCQAVRVKPLVWEHGRNGLRMDSTMMMGMGYDFDTMELTRQEGYGFGCSYIIWAISSGLGKKSWNVYGILDGIFIQDITSEDAAKAAAQADYEARIRSALTIAPAPDAAKVAALVEAAEARGAMPEGYCFCSTNRIGDDSKMHEPECRDLRAALAAMKEG